jgi:pimeloyl-ACP methyl ester carboxylesterase
MTWLSIKSDGVRLAAYDYGGRGPKTVLLLHGLAGHAREWDETASWLRKAAHVVALEQRGHGRSERRPGSMSRDAFVSDLVAWLDHLGLNTATLIGQSLGGHTAFLVAARHPSRVDHLVVAEASPAPDPASVEAARGWLESWPIPFSNRADAVEYFGGPSLWADAWSSGLEQRDRGLYPAFDIASILSALADAEARPLWHEWERIVCPTLVVRADRGLQPDVAERMVAAIPAARLITIVDSGHDLHLERPDAWRQALENFLG